MGQHRVPIINSPYKRMTKIKFEDFPRKSKQTKFCHVLKFPLIRNNGGTIKPTKVTEGRYS